MQKALTYMNLQLHHVVSDITGVTGIKIIRAIVGGERNPEELTKFRHICCKASEETIRNALMAIISQNMCLRYRSPWHLYDFYQLRVDECDKQIEQALAVLNAGKPEPNQPIPKTRQRTKQANAVKLDVRSVLYQLVGTDLTQIHGIGRFWHYA